MKKVMIFGAASAIASETAKCFAREGSYLFLVDLNKERLEAVSQDILVHAKTQISIDVLDANNFEKHNEIIQKAADSMNGLDAVLIAHGTLPDQKKIENDIDSIVKEFNTNCVSVVSLATAAASYFEPKKKGTIAVISSVAGDRGRQSNYIYGAAKGGVSIFLQGLRNRLSKSGINVVTIKPGMVDTPMTAHIPKSPLFAKPKDIGEGIYKAMKNGKDVTYLPSYWRLVMLIIKLIPEGIFKKMGL
ncbi:MAG: hypothetical protein QG635_2 [Bacteroidota bacterium]|nr:hypothetical protein [Bacteroidota bacterium]